MGLLYAISLNYKLFLKISLRRFGPGTHALHGHQTSLRRSAIFDSIHLNPVNRGYVDDAVHWRRSCARNYQGEAGLLPIYTDWAG